MRLLARPPQGQEAIQETPTLLPGLNTLALKGGNVASLLNKYRVQTQSKLVKDEDSGTSAPERDPMENVVVVAAYAEIVKDVVTHTALTVGGVFAVCKIVERICK